MAGSTFQDRGECIQLRSCFPFGKFDVASCALRLFHLARLRAACHERNKVAVLLRFFTVDSKSEEEVENLEGSYSRIVP